jgi:hypothetical protein
MTALLATCGAARLTGDNAAAAGDMTVSCTAASYSRPGPAVDVVPVTKSYQHALHGVCGPAQAFAANRG